MTLKGQERKRFLTPFSAKRRDCLIFRCLVKDGQTLSIVKGEDRTKTVNKAIELLGGIERFIKPGDVVVIKPNVGFATPPILGATTHPDVITAVVRLCYEKGKAKKVIVTDNPINDPASCFAISGIGKAAVSSRRGSRYAKGFVFQHRYA